MDLDVIVRVLGYGGILFVDILILLKGYRVLSKVFRILGNVIDNFIKEFKELSSVIDVDIDDFDKVEGIGEVRVIVIKDGLKCIKE